MGRFLITHRSPVMVDRFPIARTRSRFRRPAVGIPTERFRRITPIVAIWALFLAGWVAAGPVRGFTKVALRAPFRVLDGDTFEADLDGDGRLDFPRERVRLLYVDTPELHDSRKGKDPEHGLPAKAFLESALRGDTLVLAVPLDRPTGKYGRTLGVLWAKGREINRALIREGHSYFDTRFTVPSDPATYGAYAEAEGAAFSEGKGIWHEPASRRRYLRRLEREGKTPRSEANPLYGGGVYDAAELDPAARMGRYVRVHGVLREVRSLSKGVAVVALAARPPGGVLQVVAFPRFAERFAVIAWPVGARVVVEGFVRTYRNQLELVLHYGRVERVVESNP